jgi:acetyl esterase/lipase
MKKISILFLIATMMFFNKTNAQDKTVNVWKGEIPGSIKCATYKEKLDTTGNWSRLSNVSNPRMDVYLAPADKSTGTAVIICPGGAYGRLATGHEGIQVAKWFNSLGISAFVLKYRLPSDSIMKDKTIGPLQDAQEAMRLVRRNAKDWKINPNKIGIMGFSAGGHLASTLSTHYNDKVYAPSDTTSARPDFSILIYPVISMDKAITHQGSKDNLLGLNPSADLVAKYSNELQVNGQTPPAFLVHAFDDGAVPVENSINYTLAMKKFKVPCELHLYESGGHGFGLGRTKNTESSWPDACIKWLKQRGLL